MEKVLRDPCCSVHRSLSRSQQEVDGLHPNWAVEESLIEGLFPTMYPEYMEAMKEWSSATQVINTWKL